MRIAWAGWSSNWRRCANLTFVAALTLAATGAAGHPVSMSEARIDIQRDRIEVTLRIMAEDLVLFHELESNADYFVPKAALLEAMEKHKAFLLERFSLRNLEGRAIEGDVTAVQPPVIPDEGIHLAEAMAHYFAYDLVYPLDERPEYITILQEFSGDMLVMPSSMAVTLTREGQPIGRTFYVTEGLPFSMAIDWDRPPLAPDAPQAEVDAWLDEQRENNLGITSYGAVYSFLYIEGHDVRHEILIPLPTLETWIPVDRVDLAFIEVAEQDAAAESIGEFFRDLNPVTIDGIDVAANVDRVAFYGLDFKDFARQTPKRRLSAYTARVGAILSYPAKTPPESVAMTWELFSDRLPALYTIVYAHADSGRHLLHAREDTLEWNSPGRPERPAIASVAPPPPAPEIQIPVVSLVLGLIALVMLGGAVRPALNKPRVAVAAALVLAAALAAPYIGVSVNDPFYAPKPIAESAARDLFETLHANIYRAFDYRDEERVYDALATSVAGDLLTNLYRQIRSGLAMQEQGGAIARVQRVTLEDGSLADPVAGDRVAGRRYGYDATWTVEGTVEHWGHIHTRTNRYQARFTVEAQEEAWKITELEVLDEERVKFEMSLRSVDS